MTQYLLVLNYFVVDGKLPKNRILWRDVRAFDTLKDYMGARYCKKKKFEQKGKQRNI